MDYKVIYLPQAKIDIIEISDYLNQFYNDTLRKFIESLDKKIDALSKNPAMYEKYPPAPSYRKMGIGKYVLLYKLNDKTSEIQIYRVLRGTWDIQGILKK